jgi:hypothetical protein
MDPVVSETTWKGIPISQLSREELIEMIEYCGKEIMMLREDRSRWMRVGDPVRYLMNK